MIIYVTSLHSASTTLFLIFRIVYSLAFLIFALALIIGSKNHVNREYKNSIVRFVIYLAIFIIYDGFNI